MRRLAKQQARRGGIRRSRKVLKAVHSGVVGDYVTWVVVGTAVTGAAWALLLR